MNCQILFSGEDKENISKCRLLKLLPSMLKVKHVCNDIKQSSRGVTNFVIILL